MKFGILLYYSSIDFYLGTRGNKMVKWLMVGMHLIFLQRVVFHKVWHSKEKCKLDPCIIGTLSYKNGLLCKFFIYPLNVHNKKKML